ncbi:MAG TPA: hypothetical protein VHV10_13720, partial [Ktedonobacteraceae bacterium]|nr:hypothetical protein [Ktedonobacteraceae bacterium]
DPQKSEETIEALTKVVAEQDALARDLKKVAETVQAGAQATGLNVKQHVSKFEREVKGAAIEKQRDVLTAELATTLAKVHNRVQDLRNQPPINGYTYLNPEASPDNVGILDNLINEAQTRINTEANRPLDPAKDLITQYTERIAAVKAQGAIESARIKIITSWQETMVVSGRRPRTPDEIHTKNQEVDTIVQAAKTHADPDNRNIIQQHIAAAATAQKLASLYEQFHEAVMAAPPEQRQNRYRSSMHQSQIIRRLRDRGGPFLIQDVIAMLVFAKREALQQANAAGQPTEDELAMEVSTALQTVDQSGDTEAKMVRDAISGVQDKSDKASRDGARQAAELGQTVGETLQAIVKAAKMAETAINLETGKYTKWLAAIAMDIDRQAHNKKLSLDQRIQARITALRQAREVIVKLARSMEETANVTRTSILAALEDKDAANKSASQEAIEVINVFNKKRADIQAANGDLSTQLRAGGDAAIGFAESSVMIYKGIQDLAEQTKKHLNAFSIPKEQKERIVMKAAKKALEEDKQWRADAIAQGDDFDSKEFAAKSRCAGMEVLLHRRRGAILLTQDIDNILNAETKKIEDEVAVPPAYDQLNPLQFFEQYAMYLENPNPDPAEQASLEKIEKFFEKENNGVHDYWQNRYYLEKAIDAARRRHLYTGDKSAEHYITRMQVPTPDSTSKTPEGLRQGRVRAWASALKEAVLGDDRPEPPESLRQGREHDWVSFLKEAARHAVNTSRDDVIGHALMVVAKEQREYYSNLKLVEKALDPKTSRKEALKALDDLELAEVPLPTLPGENVT